MLKDFTPRLYQETIFNTATTKNTIVVLPTGMGKTAIALMMTAHRLSIYPNSKILILAPTKPLVEQHRTSFEQHCTMEGMTVFTGEISPEERKNQWEKSTIIFSTPQTIENDIINEKISLENVSLLVFDEAHRAIGDYAYPFIAKQYVQKSRFSRILALTASPGSETDKIADICKNLYIEAVEVRTDQDQDVAPYIQEINIQLIHVELTEGMKQAKKYVEACINSKLEHLKKYGGKINYYSKKELLGLQASIQKQLAMEGKSFLMLKCLSILAEIIKAQHALELIETQGTTSALNYMTRLYDEYGTTKVKAVKNLCEDLNFKSAYAKIQQLVEKNEEHPKLEALKKTLAEEFEKNKLTKTIIFTQYRDTAVKIKQEIAQVRGAVPEIFVGQAKKSGTGLSQKEQAAILDQFRDGLYNTLIATSVAEEGLDIPKVDSVIFYEPVPSAIRSIQRRGRTGRLEKGKVIMLITKDTRDEGYHWSAKGKEKKMQKTLQAMKKIIPEQPTLTQYQKQDLLVYADYREKGSAVIKELMQAGISIRLEMLEKGDFVISNKVGIEYKKTDDFVNSIIDGRLLQQLKEIRKFQKPLLLIEGEQDMYSIRNIHPNAIRGMLATITTSYGIPILQTKHAKETAELIIAIAKREQSIENKDHQPHQDKPQTQLKSQQEYIITSLPNIGINTAKELLKKFKSVKNIINATENELQQTEGIGEKTSKQIKEVTEKEYEEKT
ncbi:DEAD/DEAH box helicase [Candidatus Woesearchaeota archaeon]|nr:DEAD/DEAH box helicase [Candidatus Woesearchaeota archaeon]